MEILACLAAIPILGLLVGGIFGLGWLVIGPLGAIIFQRVKTPRFQLLDLFWLVLLLAPALALFGAMLRDGQGQHPQWIMIFVLIGSGIVAAWYGMTGALSKAGISNGPRRAAAVLVILPTIGVLIPLAMVFQLLMIVGILNIAHQQVEPWAVFACAVAELVFVAAIFGARQVSAWIARGVGDNLPETPETISS